MDQATTLLTVIAVQNDRDILPDGAQSVQDLRQSYKAKSAHSPRCPKWVKGGCSQQADGTAGRSPEPDTRFWLHAWSRMGIQEGETDSRRQDVLDGRPGRSQFCAMLDLDALREAVQTHESRLACSLPSRTA